MLKIILLLGLPLAFFSCQSNEHGKELESVDSLRIALITQKNLLSSFPTDSLQWCIRQIDEQQMIISNLTDSAHWRPYSNYFSLSNSIKTILKWQSELLPILLEDENRLQALKSAVKERKETDAAGNSITAAYLDTYLAKEKAHADSIGRGVLQHYTESIQAIQMVRWMLPVMNKEIENIKAKQE